jgi:Protein of unknown function (DUF3014)
MIDEPMVNKPLIGVAAAVVIALGGGWYYWHKHHPAMPVPAVAPPIVAAAASAPADAIEHPVPAPPQTSAPPLPSLGDSDAAFHAAVGEASDGSIGQYLVPENIIRHIVVTVDNLSRQKVAVDKRPVPPAGGNFMANGDELHATLDPENFQRYQPLVGAIQKADMQRLATVYLRFYPLFQDAYQDLGYPNGYFNDRLVKVIDVLLATPQPTGPIELVRPNVMYVFADPTLEARPAGQKLLIRMGPENAAVIKSKLTELRSIITAAPPKH